MVLGISCQIQQYSRKTAHTCLPFQPLERSQQRAPFAFSSRTAHVVSQLVEQIAIIHCSRPPIRLARCKRGKPTGVQNALIIYAHDEEVALHVMECV